MSCLLLLTRDRTTQALAERSLNAAGHEVVCSASANAAIRSLFSLRVDAVVVDSAIGEAEVKQFCAWRRNSEGTYPIVFLAPAGARWLTDMLPVEGEEDEIVVKPYESKDIRQAVERALEAAGGARPNVISIGDLALDRNTQELSGNGVTVQLTPTEYRLIHYLAQHRGSIVPTEELLEKVWEFFPGTGSSELVRSHVRNLRAKLRMIVQGDDVVQTVPRRGYRLQ